MRARAVERAPIPEFIFGDSLLHARFSTAIELIAGVLLAYPRQVTTTGLADALGQPPRVLRPLLQRLQRSGLIEQDAASRDTWRCRAGSGCITLADVFCCVAQAAAEVEGQSRAGGMSETCYRSCAQQGVDLLLMQATMAINQVVFQHLQAFDLDRLRALRSGPSFDSVVARSRAALAQAV